MLTSLLLYSFQVLHSRVGLLTLLTNITLGREDLTGTDTIAYYENYQITDRKGFITLATGGENEFFLPKVRLPLTRHLISKSGKSLYH